MAGPPPDADGDLRLDLISDADLFSFLETLSGNDGAQQEPGAPVLDFEAAAPASTGNLVTQNSGSHSGDSSSGGHPTLHDNSGGSRDQGQRVSSHGEHESPAQRGLSVRKTSGDRDKNKNAQRAFRQRKKEKEKAKEQQLEELMEKLRVAEAEREQLTRHNMLLERAIVARDRVAAEFIDAKTAGGGGYGLESPKKHARILRPALDWRDNLEWTPDDTLQLTLGDGHAQWELKGSGMDARVINEIKPVWKTLVNKIAAALVEAEREPAGQGPASARVAVLVAEATSIPAFLARLSPLLIHQWATAKLGDVQFGPQNPTSALWRSIEANMMLRSEQKTQLLDLRRTLLQTMATLLQERRMIQALIKDVEGTMNINKEDLSLKMWQLQEAVQRLRANVKAVHDTKCRLFSNAWRQVLDRLQCAKLIVQSFPFPPDLLSVISCLVEEAGEPTAGEMLAQRPAPAPSFLGLQPPGMAPLTASM